MMMLSIVLAVVVPISYLYIVHWLDLYGSDRPRIVLMCFGWGLVAFALSFLVNRFCLDFLGMQLPFVATRTAPFVEEVFKAGILVYLMRRAKLNYFLDGAIYGFASGIGFAVIENLRYIQRYPDNYFGTVVLRDFSSALGHGTMTAMTGIALGGFVLSARGGRGIRPLVVGLIGAMSLHYLWNIFSFFSPFSRFTTEWILVGVALTGLGFVATMILWGLHRERLELRDTLGMNVGVSREESSVIQHMDDLDRLLVPIQKRFGKVKRRQVADFLHLEAQLGLNEDAHARTTDPRLRAVLAAEVEKLERELDLERRKLGVYVMLYVRSIFPETSWSLWARLSQTLSKVRTPRTSLWGTLDARPAAIATSSPGMYARVQAELDARLQAAALTMHHVHELPETMQKCVHWIIAEVHVTVEHVAAGLGHHETHIHAMLNDLVARGFLHRTTKDGQAAFRARAISDEARAARPHIWQLLERKQSQS